VVTKDSGEAGGLPAKIAAARALKIPLIVVSRPVMHYPKSTKEPAEVSQWLADLSFFKNAP
jgi:precorrin-6x reductase